MKLTKDIRPENVQGTWFNYPNEQSELQLCIRPIHPAKALEIERKHLGRRRDFKVGADYRTVEVDLEALDRVALEKASFALLDSKNATVEIGDEDSKRFYSKLAKRELQVGDEFTLDGNWVPPVKDRIFADLQELVAFVNEKAAALNAQAVAKEEGLKSEPLAVDTV